MEIFEQIKADHKGVKKLIGQIKGARSAQRRRLFIELRNSLWAHTKAEEVVFYGFLESQNIMKEEMMEARNEHHQSDMALEELSLMPEDSKEWEMKLEVLSELLEHHIDEEENEIMPEAKEHMEESDEHLSKEFKKRKEKILEALEPL